MLSLPPSVRVFLAVEPVDMRKSFDALALLVEHVLQQDPLSGRIQSVAASPQSGSGG